MNEEISTHALLARIDERTENTLHRLRNLEMKLEAQSAQFVPRTEIEQRSAATLARIASLEDSRAWLIKAVWGAWLAGSGTVIAGVVGFLKTQH